MANIRKQIVEKDGQTIIEEIHRIKVFEFVVYEDINTDYLSEIERWKNSNEGIFILKNCVNKPELLNQKDFTMFATRYAIIAELEQKKLTEYYLKFGKL